MLPEYVVARIDKMIWAARAVEFRENEKGEQRASGSRCVQKSELAASPDSFTRLITASLVYPMHSRAWCSHFGRVLRLRTLPKMSQCLRIGA